MTWRRVAGVCGALVALAGCSSSEGQQVATDAGTTVLIAGAAADGMDAITRGTVEIVGSCLGARSGSQVYVVVWPSGASTTGDTIEVEGRRVAVGDFFQGGGGYLDAPYPEALPDIPQECLDEAGSDQVMWVQSITDVRPAAG